MVTEEKLEKLKTNPFLFKGKRLCLCGEFLRMISEDTATFAPKDFKVKFTPFVISSVPMDLLPISGEITLAARVLGMTETDVFIPLTGAGRLKVPHLEYLGYVSGDITKYIDETLKIGN